MNDAIGDGDESRPDDVERIDLTGVDPLRFAEVERRVSAVRTYLSTAVPTEADRVRGADEVGLSVNQFMALVRSWREHGRASDVSGSGAARGTARPNGRRSLPRDTKEITRGVIADLGPGARHVDAVRAVDERCAALGVPAPSRSTIWNLMVEVRGEAQSRGSATGLVVARPSIRLPTMMRGGLRFPRIILATDRATAAVIAATMQDDPESILAIAAARKSDGAAVLIDSELTGTQFAEMTEGIGLVKPSAARTATALILGDGFGKIRLIYQPSRAIDPSRALRSAKDQPLSFADARRVVADNLIDHNRARGAPPPALMPPR